MDVFMTLKKYYRKIEQTVDKNYRAGRNFEYRVMRHLRRRGFHCMRRFGSHDEKIKGIGNVPVDVTAFKNGIYLIISCKYSNKHATCYLDDPKYPALVKYAHRFNAIPLFAGITEDRKIYFVDLRTLSPFDVYYRFKVQDADKEQIEKLIKQSWEVIELCNEFINDPDADMKEKRKWATVKVNMINVINRVLYRAGQTGTAEDLTKLLEEESTNNVENRKE